MQCVFMYLYRAGKQTKGANLQVPLTLTHPSEFLNKIKCRQARRKQVLITTANYWVISDAFYSPVLGSI